MSSEQQQQQQQLQQVQEAARAVVHPLTDASTRTAASQWLEAWTASPHSWSLHVAWLQAMVTTVVQQQSLQQQQEEMGLSLLCLQLLQSKLRKQVPRNQPDPQVVVPILEPLHHVLTQLLVWLDQHNQNHTTNNNNNANHRGPQALLMPATICYAALAVRCGGLSTLVSELMVSRSATPTTPPTTSPSTTMSLSSSSLWLVLKVVVQIPMELGTCNDLTTVQVTAELQPHLPTILETCGHVLAAQQQQPPLEDDTTTANASRLLVAALDALETWTRACHVSLSQLLECVVVATRHTSSPPPPQDYTNKSLLWLLLQLVSEPNHHNTTASGRPPPLVSWKNPMVLILTCRILTEALVSPTDACTPQRLQACQLLMQAMQPPIQNDPAANHHPWTNCFVAPLEYSTTCLLSSLSSPNDHHNNPQALSSSLGWTADDCTSIAHAVATVVATLVTEEVDWIVATEGTAAVLIPLLLQGLQDHPSMPVTSLALECWLTIQQVPTRQRLPAYQSAQHLWIPVVTSLIRRIAYPTVEFVSWSRYSESVWSSGGSSSSSLVVEQEEWDELRRLVPDVWIGCYFSLRSQFVQCVTHSIMTTIPTTIPTTWVDQEAALFALTVTAREIQTRLTSSHSTKSIVRDKHDTVQSLVALAQYLCQLSATWYDPSQAAASLSNSNHQASSSSSYSYTALSGPSPHPLLVAKVCDCLGAHGSVWNAHLDAAAVGQILTLLTRTLQWHASKQEFSATTATAAAKAWKQVVVACTPVLTTAVPPTALSTMLSHAMELALSLGEMIAISNQNDENDDDDDDDDEPSMEQAVLELVAEGSVRCIVQVSDPTVVQALLGTMTRLVVQHADLALTQLSSAVATNPNISEELAHKQQALSNDLFALQVMIRFSETGTSGDSSSTSPLETMLSLIWPLLEHVSQQPWILTNSKNSLLPPILALHEQLLKSMPWFVAPRFEPTMNFVVQVLEKTHDFSTLTYMVSAMETFSGGNGVVFDFGPLLTHVYRVVSSVLYSKQSQQTPSPRTALSMTTAEGDSFLLYVMIGGFFLLCGRSLLYAPLALPQCPVLSDVVTLAVACLVECQGEANSTRQVLNFLTKFYGWRSLPLSTEHKRRLEEQSSSVLDNLMMQHGPRVVQACLEMLLGGSQILWGSSSDCLFALVAATTTTTTTTANTSPTHPNQTASTSIHAVSRPWLEAVPIPSEHGSVYHGTVIHLLVQMAAQGPTKQKAKARLLLSDFCNIVRGEASPEVLISYSLP